MRNIQINFRVIICLFALTGLGVCGGCGSSDSEANADCVLGSSNIGECNI